MIGYVKGKLLYAKSGTALLECGGVGYEINCSATVYSKLVENNGGEVYTYLAVKEDGMYLYGFDSIEEKNMFLSLISVSGVGPKMGITVLSNMNLKDLAVKIATSDVKGLSSVKGLGKKTAERIILELREKIQAVEVEETIVSVQEDTTPVNEDAVIALMSLGLKKGEAVQLVKDAQNGGAESVQDIVTFALKNYR